jgi:uncharacterized DUF497 family protein
LKKILDFKWKAVPDVLKLGHHSFVIEPLSLRALLPFLRLVDCFFDRHEQGGEKAADVFLDPLAVSIFDESHSIDGERWVTMGRDKRGMILVVIHTFVLQGRDKRKIRIISARKATRNETKQHEGETP